MRLPSCWVPAAPGKRPLTTPRMRLLLPLRLLSPLPTPLLPRVTRRPVPPPTRALLLPMLLRVLPMLLPVPPTRLPTLPLRPRNPLLRRSKRLL